MVENVEQSEILLPLYGAGKAGENVINDVFNCKLYIIHYKLINGDPWKDYITF
jgi:hypothetical protein